MTANCTLCEGPVDHACSVWRWLLDFLTLYLVGVYELLRQWLLSRTEHSQQHHAAAAQLRGFRKANPLVLLTGCASGVGLEILRQLSSMGLDIIAITHFASTVLPVNCQQIALDFSSKLSVDDGCVTISRRLEGIDAGRPVILIHCAAIFHPEASTERAENASPVITTLNVNLLMPCLFVKGIGHLLSGIIWIGSSSHSAAPSLRNIRCPLHVAKTPFSMYPLSKLLSLVYVEQWSLANAKPVAVIHPGVVATGLYKHERGVMGKTLSVLIPLFAWNATSSAKRVLQLIEVGTFLERIQSGVDSSCTQFDSRRVYWDTVRMRQGVLPEQIRDYTERSCVARKLFRALEADVF